MIISNQGHSQCNQKLDAFYFGNETVSNKIWISLLDESFFDDKLIIKYFADENGKSDDLEFFRQQLDSLKTNFSEIWDEISDLYADNKNVYELILYDHPELFFAGEIGVDDDDNKNTGYFIKVRDLRAFPDCAKSLSSDTDNWVSTKCTFLAHELVEIIDGKSHRDGMDIENRLREISKINEKRFGEAQMEHDDHCDWIFPIGDHIEIIHMKPGSRIISGFTYH